LEKPIPSQTLTWTVKTPPNQPGRFPITLKADGLKPVTTYIVLGDRHGPEAKQDFNDKKGPVQAIVSQNPAEPFESLKVLYSVQKIEGQEVFWKPVDHFHGRIGKPAWLAPWLIVYLLAYIPAMFLTKWILRVA